jgi:CheY-like chemotaxis protein
MPQFTAFKRPSRLVFLDDDEFFLKVLHSALPSTWHADLFMDATACITYLNEKSNGWSADVQKQQALLADAKNSDLGMMSIIPLLLSYWRESQTRYGLVQVATFDYAMPILNGLDAFALLQDWPGQRVLLTGQADEKVAVAAFNKSLINLFLTKQGVHFLDDLFVELPKLLSQQIVAQQLLWLQSLSPEQQLWLAEPTVIDSLNQWVLKTGLVEYAVTHAPFGVLGVDRYGIVFWLQLEQKSDLEELACMAEEQGLDPSAALRIRSGSELANTDLCFALEGSQTIATSAAFSLGLNESKAATNEHLSDTLLGAVWLLGDAHNLSQTQSYNAWSAENPSQIIMT